MTELKPCPFCGGKAEIAETEIEGFELRCKDCPCDFGRFWFPTEIEAVEAWNRRISNETD